MLYSHGGYLVKQWEYNVSDPHTPKIADVVDVQLDQLDGDDE